MLAAGDLHLDPAARTVRRGEAGVELTAREFALLEYLMRRAGQVVSKAELLEHVWDPDAVADLESSYRGVAGRIQKRDAQGHWSVLAAPAVRIRSSGPATL